MINHSMFVFPFDRLMSEEMMELELQKIRGTFIEDADDRKTHLIGLRGCSMSTHCFFQWQEMTAEDFADGIQSDNVYPISPDHPSQPFDQNPDPNE